MDNTNFLDYYSPQQIGNVQSFQNVLTTQKPSSALLPILSSIQLIPSPKDIYPQLESIGLSTPLAKEVSDAYLKVSNELRTVCESSFRNAIAVASSKGSDGLETIRGLIKIWSDIHSQQTNIWAETSLSRARKVAADFQLCKTSPNPKDSKKPSFNHEYTPLLEKYFEYNAYPSAPDREVLARKSMMTSRQIEVWFQNHRNRAKKEGKTFRKLTSGSLPLELSLESLEQQMPSFIIPERQRKAVVDSDSSVTESSDEEGEESPEHIHSSCLPGVFTSCAPPHAFPTIYPPTCNYDPFPTKTGKYTFPAPVWMRTPSPLRPCKEAINFDDFITDFTTKLVFRDNSTKIPRRKSPPPSTSPWFAATHTRPSPAPHPAFIPSSVITTRVSIPAIPIINAPSPRLHPFRSPTPHSPPATLVPRTRDHTNPRRKVARLPKRMPQNASIAHRGTSPTTSESSSSPSSRFSSRTSSFSSDTSSDRRPSSSSGSSSSASSTLTTPVSDPTPLPDNAPSPSVSISGIDFQDTDDLFGDSLDAMSPLDGLELNLPIGPTYTTLPSQGKDIFGFGFENNSQVI